MARAIIVAALWLCMNGCATCPAVIPTPEPVPVRPVLPEVPILPYETLRPGDPDGMVIKSLYMSIETLQGYAMQLRAILER